jgi:gliding motility-associated-like protein
MIIDYTFLKNMKKLYVLILFTLFSVGLHAQNEGKIWYFGNFAGLNFNTEPPTVLTNGALTTSEGCASISDADGSLLFYTDGVKVWNKNNQQMTNGNGLGGDPSSTQSGIIVPFPGNKNQYYIFTTSSYGNPIQVKYSIVDITLNSGLGDVILASKATTILSGANEVVQATISADGTFWWIVTQKLGSYYAYKLTSSGFDSSNPVISTVGTALSANGSIGYLKFNPANNLMARADYFNGYFELFDFNSSTGVISNPRKLTYPSAYGAEFSPNGEFLYISAIPGLLKQYSLSDISSASQIAASAVQIGSSASYGAIQSAPNGKMYVAINGTTSLGVINNPNVAGTGSNYVANGQSLGGKFATLGLPNIISSFVSTGPPQISSIASSNVTSTAATISADVTSDGGAAITERGFYYGTTATPTTNKTVVSGTTGSLSSNLSGLTAGTTYYFRGFATNTNGTAYTVDGSFTTTSAPTNTAPTFSSLFNQETSGTMPTEVQPFTVADAETAVDSLVVTASSSNTTLIPNANIILGGTGASRNVVVTAASGQKGTATITLTVTDAQGANSTATFTVTVTDPSCSPFKITDFKLNGNATAASSIITLTTAQGNRFGGSWNKNKVYLDQDFDISSKVFLGNKNGADGLAFVLQNQSISAGTFGGGLGYLGITPSFAVEFDTYWNGAFEPVQDHIAIIKNGAADGVHNTYATPFEVEMEDGQWHAVRFIWTASTKNFQVYYEGVKRFDITVDLKASIFNNADFVYWGFVAATGGQNNLQQVDIGEYCYVPQATITPTAGTENATAALTFCSGADVVLEASYSASYKWYKDNVLLSNTSQTYTATETGSYKVETVSNIGAITSFSDAVAVQVNAGPSFSYAAASYTFIKNNAITSISPSLASGSAVPNSYSVSPSLPAGLSFNTANGTISGTPSAGNTSANYIVRATTAGGCSSTDTVAIEVSECTLSPSVFSRVDIAAYGDDRVAVLKSNSGISALGTQDYLVGSLMVVNGVEYKLISTWNPSDTDWYYFRTSPLFPNTSLGGVKVSFRCNSNPIITGPNGTGTTIEALAAKSIAENTKAVGSYIADETVTWSISGTDVSKFTMSAAGVLTFTSAPDYENPSDVGTNNTYIVIITATDASGNTTTQTLTVTITDVDDTPPLITGPNGTGTTTASTAAKSIPENTTAVGTYTANEAVTWGISGGVDAALFSLNPSTGALSFNTAPKFATPTDADANNTYIVTVLATDNVGNTTTQTITVTVLLDSDGDGLPDITDPDDDNDGLPDTDELDCSASTGISESLNPSSFYFVQWNSYAGGVLRGVINVPGNPVNVTVTNSSGSILQRTDTPYGGTSMWAPTPAGNPVSSTFRSSTLGEHKFTFDRPINNPRFFINSLNRILDLSLPGKILKSNGLFTGTPDGSTTTVLNGNEGTGTISFNGNVTEVSFTGRSYEFYCNFSLGIANVADYSSCIDIDTDGDGIPNRLDTDSDGDGVTDGKEKTDGTNHVDFCSFILASQTVNPSAAWNAKDCDDDGVSNQAEVTRGTNPLVKDIPPVITGPNGNGTSTGATSAKAFPENSTALIYTFTSNKTVTWSLNGGEDAAKFTIDSTTGAVTFSSALNFENPEDGSTSGNNTYIVVIKATDVFGLTTSQTLTVSVTNVNEAPTNISLSASSIAENNAVNAIVGSLSSTDPDAGNTHTYTLVSGAGSTDNATFSINGKSLKVNTSLNFEAKSSYSIRIKTTDAGGLSYEKVFAITVTNVNEVPTNIALSTNSIAENNAAGAVVGTLSTSDVDAGDTHTYTLVSGAGSTDNATFSIAGANLKVNNSLNFEAKSSYSILIRTTDAGGLSFEKVFTINVTNVNEAPTNITSSQIAIYEANANGATVSNLSSTDQDAGDTHTYTLVSGAGSTDNASFSISGNQLKANTVFVFKTKSTYSIRLRTTDAGGLTFEKVFTITILESPVATGTGNVLGTSTITAASNNVTISKGYSSQLRVRGTGLVTFSWSPSTSLSSTNVANPIANPTQTTVYAVRVTNTMGLSTTVYVTVNVVEDYNITPNNIITPNGDGVNDKWVIGNLSAYPNNQVSIFDKAGRLIYQESNYQNGWDGTLNGVPLHENTYYFVITFEPGIKPKKGFITLVRDNN